jgi:hypothetical protein
MKGRKFQVKAKGRSLEAPAFTLLVRSFARKPHPLLSILWRKEGSKIHKHRGKSRRLLVNLRLVAFADPHISLSESEGAGFRSYRSYIKYGLNSTPTFGTINHVLFFSNLIRKGGYLSGHLFSFLFRSTVGSPPSAAFLLQKSFKI